MTTFNRAALPEAMALEAGSIVQLFTLDLSKLGGASLYFTPNIEGVTGNPLKFRGITYEPMDLIIDGFEVTGRGVLPRPQMKIANTHRALVSIMRQYEDMIGGRVHRLRTFEKYLDGSPSADPTAHYPVDVFVINRKTAMTKMFIEFELAAAIDVEGQMIPRRKVLHDYCSRIYRRWDTDLNTFDYSKAQCPYTGDAYWDGINNPATAQTDKCAKNYRACQLRFGGNIPGWFFPGAGRFGSGR